MASITEPQPVLQKSEHSRKGDDESGIDDGMKGKLRRDTISGKLKFWSGNNANAREKKVEGFPKMDEGTLKTFVEKVKPFDFEKDMEEWEDEKFSHDSNMDPLVCILFLLFAIWYRIKRIAKSSKRVILTHYRTGVLIAKISHSSLCALLSQ